MAAPHYRKVELQSPADFTYLYANTVALSRQKLDLNLPPSATNDDKPDPMRERVRELVDEVRSASPQNKQLKPFKGILEFIYLGLYTIQPPHLQRTKDQDQAQVPELTPPPNTVHNPHLHNSLLLNQHQRARLLITRLPLPLSLHRTRNSRIRTL